MSDESCLPDSCPFNMLNKLFSRKWILYILKDLFEGKRYFNEFKKTNPLMSNASLSNNLRYLEEEGLIIKNVLDDKKHTTEYILSDKGKKMNKILYEMILFGLDELVDVDDENFKEETRSAYGKLLINDSE